MEEIIREGSLRILAAESTCDVIISCHGYKLMAHKIILSIASPVLQELLQADSSQPSVLIFPEMSSSTMTLILDYIYTGHAHVLLSELAEFINVAKLLKLRLEEDNLKMLASSCDQLQKCVKFDDFDVKLEVKETKVKCRRVMPRLIPIDNLKKRGLFNKVIPSPWTPRDVQVFDDPKAVPSKDYSGSTDSSCVNKNQDSNNNVETSTCVVPLKVSELLKDESTKNEGPAGAHGAYETEPSNPVSDDEARKILPKEKPFKCNDCGKSFSQLRNYKYHRSIHNGTKEFSARCPECGKVFNDRGYLSSHMKIHRDRKEYACQHCPKRFNQRVAYNMHLRIHTGLKPHECSECGKTFSRKMLLKQHQRVHTGERPYTCSECGKSFADRSNMSLHARLHTGVKPYACTLCPKSFTKKHHLKTHMNFHTGLKPYSCDNCSLAFSQSSNMRTHYKKCILKQADEVTPTT